MATPPRVFISYCHADEAWKDRVVQHVRVLAPTTVWDDRRIAGGDDWRAEIEEAMDTCDVALLLVSAAFLTSDFILGTEVPALLKRRESEGLRVIPVILKPSAWHKIGWLKSIQARPKDGKPLSAMAEHDADQALADLAIEVDGFLNARAGPPAPASGALSAAGASLPPPVRTLRSSPGLLARALLQDLFLALFNPQELRRFVAYLPGGDDLEHELPTGGSAAEYSFALTRALESRGTVDGALFNALLAERPRRASDIDHVRRAWGA